MATQTNNETDKRISKLLIIWLPIFVVVIATLAILLVRMQRDDFNVPVHPYTLEAGRDTGWRIRCYTKGPSEYGKDHWHAYKNSPEFPGEGNYKIYYGSECDGKTEFGYLERR